MCQLSIYGTDCWVPVLSNHVGGYIPATTSTDVDITNAVTVQLDMQIREVRVKDVDNTCC
jgi:hypothetical protein